jgi:hypothetical protein
LSIRGYGRPMRFTTIALCTLVLGLCASQPASAWFATDTLSTGVKVEAQFVDPDVVADHVDEIPVLERVKQMIYATPNTGTIIMGLYSIDYKPIYDALVDAKRRGVKVKIVQSGDQDYSRQPADKQPGYGNELEALLGADHVFCGMKNADGSYSNYSCLGFGAGAIQHSKYILFSQTKDASGTMRGNVTWVGTANLTTTSGGAKINDAITVYDDPDLVSYFFWSLFVPQFNQSERSFDFMSTPHGHYVDNPSTGIEVQASPSPADPVLDQLNRISSGQYCQIRTIQQHFTRKAIGTRLANMSINNGGCNIQVLAEDWGQCAAGLELLWNGDVPFKQRTAIHSKTFVIQGGGQHRYILTGSHNLMPAALNNDEILVKVPADSLPNIYNAYVAYFNRAWTYPGSSYTVSCDNGNTTMQSGP